MTNIEDMKLKNKWSGLYITQFLGVLNDNLLKNLIVFISAFWVAEKDMVISTATALLVLPFLLFSSLAGRWAQTFRKAWIVEKAKLAEIPIMLLSITGFYLENIYIVLASLLLMGLQSTIYSPSKYGLIRDIGGNEGLSKGTGTMELLTFLGVLIGTFIAGLVSDIGIYKTHLLSILLLLFAIAGWVSSRAIKVEEANVIKSDDSLWPHKFVLESFRWAKNIKGLNYTILGLGAFWFIGSMLQMAVIVHMPAPEFYGFSNTSTSLVMAALAIGIGIGCWIAGLMSHHRVESGMVPLGGIGMSICITVLGFVPLPAWLFIGFLVLTAFFSGFFKVPLNAWIQERVEGRKLGQMLAYNNNVLFLFILISAGLFALIMKFATSMMVFKVVALSAWAITFITMVNIPGMMSRFLLLTLGRIFYKVKVNGVQHIPVKSGALVVANHISIVDFILVAISIPRSVRFVMMREVYEKPYLMWWLKRLNMIPVPMDRDAEALKEFSAMCQDEIRQGHVVCIFPEGQISRNGHLHEFKKGMEHIAHSIGAPIIPMHIDGVRGYAWTYDLKTGRLRKPGLKFRRRGVLVNIGEPQMDLTAFEARLKVMELASENYALRVEDSHINLVALIKEAKALKKPLIYGESPENTYKEIWQIASWMQASTSSNFELSIYKPASMAKWLLASVLAGVTVRLNMLDEMSEKVKIEEQWVEISKLQFPTSKVAMKATTEAAFEVQDADGQWILIKQQNIYAALMSLSEVFDQPENSRVMSMLPVHSAWFISVAVFNALYRQLELVLPDSQNQSIDLITSAKPHVLLASAQQVADLYQKSQGAFSSGLKRIITGSDELPDSIKKELVQKLNIEVYQSLGFTACGPIVALNTPDMKTKDLGGKAIVQRGSRNGALGRIVPGMAAQIRSIKNAKVLQTPEEAGELWVKGPSVTSLNSEDRWYNTGYLASIDSEGFVWKAGSMVDKNG